MRHDTLERWESLPLWALGLSNGLNIALWYVLSMARIDAPELPIRVLAQLAQLLPLIVAVGGVAAAVSLDGVLIATIAGARHGRRGIWTWLTIVGACGFSAAIAYAVHAGKLNEAPALHVAQAVVLALYNLHLSQSKKPLQHDASLLSGGNGHVNGALTDSEGSEIARVDAFRCRSCGEPFASLRDLNMHRRDSCAQTGKSRLLYDHLPSVKQHTNGHNTDKV